MKKVISHNYGAQIVSICLDCENKPNLEQRLADANLIRTNAYHGVYYGLHRGYCDLCEYEKERKLK